MTATNELEKLREACSSEDSRAALDRMQSFIIGGIEAEESALRLAGCASKVRNHRIRTAAFVVFVTLASSVLLALVYLTLRDMQAQSGDCSEGYCRQ